MALDTADEGAWASRRRSDARATHQCRSGRPRVAASRGLSRVSATPAACLTHASVPTAPTIRPERERAPRCPPVVMVPIGAAGCGRAARGVHSGWLPPPFPYQFSQATNVTQTPGATSPSRRCAGSRPGVGRRGKGGSSPCSPCSAACVLCAAARGSGPDPADRLSRRPPIARPGRTAPEKERRRHGAGGTSGCERSDHGREEHSEARAAAQPLPAEPPGDHVGTRHRARPQPHPGREDV
jgi:hypothetical protein